MKPRCKPCQPSFTVLEPSAFCTVHVVTKSISVETPPHGILHSQRDIFFFFEKTKRKAKNRGWQTLAGFHSRRLRPDSRHAHMCQFSNPQYATTGKPRPKPRFAIQDRFPPRAASRTSCTSEICRSRHRGISLRRLRSAPRGKTEILGGIG